MRRLSIKRILALAVCSAMLTASIPDSLLEVNAQEQSGKENSDKAVLEYSNERISNNYTRVSANYTCAEYTGNTLTYNIADVSEDGYGELTTDNNGYKESKVLKLNQKEEAKLNIDVPQDGIYYVSFDYMSADESILPIEGQIKINGEYSFYELRRQVFESLWAQPEEKSYDSYGNEIVSVPDKVYEWQNKYIMDATYRYSGALGVELKKGKNEISLTLSEGNMLLGNVYLTARPEIKAYDGNNDAEGEGFIEIQAEDFTYRNSPSIHATCEYDPDLYPYNSKDKVLNTIDSTSFDTAGQKISYKFKAEKSGYYRLAVNYSQSDKTDFPVFLNIDIDGTIPNEEFNNHPFAYNKDYDLYTLADKEGKPLSVYLEEGEHLISMTISLEPIREGLETVEEVMSKVNDLSLDITKVVGTNKDKYRDFSLTSYIPGIGDTLNDYADRLEKVMQDALAYNPDVEKIAAFSSVLIASNQLRSLAEDPDELLYRISELATSANSVNKYLANLIDSLNGNNIAIDSIYLYQDGAKSSLPKKTGAVKRGFESVKRFTQSFAEQAYSVSNTDKTHLQVWVNRSRQYLEIMQQMIDEKFTPQTGIEVDLSLMPDQNKLVLANASGDSPDIATGINYSIPFELGIRGAIKDLTQFDDFDEVASNYSDGLLLASTIGDGIYAVPETMNFSVLFYRTDILEKLGLEVPDTLDDVKAMLPDLQMRGLNFYYPTARTTGTKTFLDTTPILFQTGADLYDVTADNTLLNSESLVAGFTELTNLFTIYNLPVDCPNFYQHFRNGDYPIGISDFGTYNLLSNAAPEIDGSWSVALIPGIERDGDVIRYSSAGAESTVMFNSTQEREEKSWEFMKWWASADVQAEFGQILQITYGDEYYWNTANMEAFSSLPWKSDDKEVILEQLKWTKEAPRALGSYMVERELSNAYNAVVVEGKTVREALDSSAKVVTKETNRKLEEFGYVENGETVKDYVIPTIERVKEILQN